LTLLPYLSRFTDLFTTGSEGCTLGPGFGDIVSFRSRELSPFNNDEDSSELKNCSVLIEQMLIGSVTPYTLPSPSSSNLALPSETSPLISPSEVFPLPYATQEDEENQQDSSFSRIHYDYDSTKGDQEFANSVKGKDDLVGAMFGQGVTEQIASWWFA
jgi:hypothetical protein